MQGLLERAEEDLRGGERPVPYEATAEGLAWRKEEWTLPRQASAPGSAGGDLGLGAAAPRRLASDRGDHV